MAQRDLTRAAEILAGRRGTNPCPKGYPWDNGTARDSQQPTDEKRTPVLDSSVPPIDGTSRDNVPVPLSHHPIGVGHGTRGTAGDVRAAASSCSECAHVTRYGNCGEPVAAGLVEHFGLVRHPGDGRGCVAFAARGGEPAGDPRAYAHFLIRGRLARPAMELDQRLALLLAAGAIDDADAQLVRERFDAHPAEEWLTLLDWCEAAVLDAATAGEAAPLCGDRPAAGRQVAADTEKRAGGPILPASRLSAEVSSAREPDSAPSTGTLMRPTHVPTQQPGAERSLFD